MVVLTVKKKTDMVDIDVVVGWMLQPATGAVMDKRERES
jgi:hypothetical protein